LNACGLVNYSTLLSVSMRRKGIISAHPARVEHQLDQACRMQRQSSTTAASGRRRFNMPNVAPVGTVGENSLPIL
jgi:hypothetical protein